MKKILSALKNPKAIQIGILTTIFILVVGGYFYFTAARAKIHIENSVISAPITSLSSTTPGKLKQVYVFEGQRVKKGDVLATVGTEDIKAYSDGIVIETNKQIGTYITSQVAVTKLINLAQMRIDGVIDENKGLREIKTGQVVSFTVDAIPGKKFWGYVDEVSQTARQTQLSFSISSERPVQQFDVYARFDAEAYPQIKNGMSAKMTIYTDMP